jgi:hypothetical protein
MFTTFPRLKPAAPAPPVFEIACLRCGLSLWVNVLVCDRYEQDGWPTCCGEQVQCFVFGNRDVQYMAGLNGFIP